MGFRCSTVISQAFLCVLALVAVQAAVDGKPEYACQSLFFPFCDTSKAVGERVDDLISRLDLQEKTHQLSNTAASIPRLGIPSYQWWQEALHGVAESPGVTFNGSIKSATSFPQTILTASSFNDSLFHQIAQVKCLGLYAHSGLLDLALERHCRWNEFRREVYFLCGIVSL